MACDAALNNALSKTFITALLTTGNLEGAEAAVLEGISLGDPCDESADTLFAGALKAAIGQRSSVWDGSEEMDRVSSFLPLELRWVLRLVPNLRHCFVCRVLAGLPREVCASLLHLEVRQLDESTCTAVRKLATIAANEGPESMRQPAISRLPNKRHGFLTLTDLE